LAATVIALFAYQNGLDDIEFLNLSDYPYVLAQSDSADGGSSAIAMERTDSSIIVDYELKEGYAYPYAGVKIFLGDGKIRGKDLSHYDSIFVWIKPRGEGTVRLYLRGYDADFYREGDEESKADLLSQWACDLNPEVTVDYYEGELNEFTLPALFEDCDILVDCLDNMETRRLLNDFAMESGKILVHAGVTGYIGQVTVIIPGKTPGLEEIYRYVKPSAGTPPSVGSMVSLIGSLEATQVIQMITGTGSPFVGKLATVDLQDGSMEIISLS
jgi:hypothetical protein